MHTVWLPDIRFLHPYTWVSISTDDQRVSSVILLREVGYFSPWKEKQLALYNVENKKHEMKM